MGSSWLGDEAATIDQKGLAMTQLAPLVDRFGRVHSSLRISVTDRCNIRCSYCMPDEHIRFLPRRELLTYEEIGRFVRVAVKLGIRKLRITGGEPLVRSDLPQLIRLLASQDQIQEIALTTNGILLVDQARELKESGVNRVNISLDALHEETFQRIARRDGLNRVLRGIATAKQVGFPNIRLNALVIAGLNDNEIVPLAQFARQHQLELRFIEFMPLDAEDNWQSERVLSGEQVRRTLELEFGPLLPVERSDASQPAVDFEFADGQGRIGFINSVTKPFCGDCNRLRLTAEGQVRNCLFSTTEWDAREVLRSDRSDDDLVDLIRDCVLAKKIGHGIDSDDFVKPRRAMYQIGG